MNRLSVLFTLMVVFGYSPPQIFAMEKTVTTVKNIYGGETIEITFTKEDNNFTQNKIIEYFNSRGELRKKVVFRKLTAFNKLKIDKIIELYAHDGTMQSVEMLIDVDRVKETGIASTKTHFFPDKSVQRKEVYYGKSDFADQIYSKSIEFYNLSGAKVRTEYHLTKEKAVRTGYSKLVFHYSLGKLVRQEFQE